MAKPTNNPPDPTRRVTLGRAEFVPLSRDDEDAAIEALAELLDQPARLRHDDAGHQA